MKQASERDGGGGHSRSMYDLSVLRLNKCWFHIDQPMCQHEIVPCNHHHIILKLYF